MKQKVYAVSRNANKKLKLRKVQNLWSEIFDNVNITDEQLKEDVFYSSRISNMISARNPTMKTESDVIIDSLKDKLNHPFDDIKKEDNF